MAEYLLVEKPFLDQLSALGWTVIDQGVGVPTDPARSRRASFRECVLKDDFKRAVRALNALPDGRGWLTEKQLDDLHEELAGYPGKGLLEANEDALRRLFKSTVDRNEVTGEDYPEVTLIDWRDWRRNEFLAVNQFRIDTPGQVKNFICPDIVLFVNGLPFVVVECKDATAVAANPLHECFLQLMRYSEQREETRRAGLREGEPRLFHYNQLLVRTTGEKADYGTITSTEEEFFAPWNDIYPEEYRAYTPPLGKERAQERLIQGMLAPEILLDITRHCTIFMEINKVRVKVACRYQQYRAMRKIVERLRTEKTPGERSGVVWHTQGSGKSLTMVFIVRKLRTCEDLKDYKVVMVNDRTDLEEQLGETATLTGEKVTYIESTDDLRTKLASRSSNLNMVMVHKFREGTGKDVPGYLAGALGGLADLRAVRGREPVRTHPGDDRRGPPHPVERPRGELQRQPLRSLPQCDPAGVHGDAPDHRPAHQEDRATVRVVHRQVQAARSRGRRGDGPDPLRGADGGHGTQGQARVRHEDTTSSWRSTSRARCGRRRTSNW